MSVKLIQYFDIISGHEEEFTKFAAKNYIPGVNETGLVKIAGTWKVSAGEGPTVIMEGVAESVKNIHQLLEMDEFKKLIHLLHFLVTKYQTKILAPTGQVTTFVPEQTNYRFNRHFDIDYNQYQTYKKFMEEEYIPTMERLGLKMIGKWYVALGPGPNTVHESTCPSVQQVLDVISSSEYQNLTSQLLTMVKGLGSKILVPMDLSTAEQ